MTDSGVITKAAAEELKANQEILEKFRISVQLTADLPVLEDTDLDRKSADEQDAANLAEMSASNNLYQQAALISRINEEHRIRRDIRIVRAGHRELMLSALRILDMRNDDLRALLDARER